jgi:hypothetical protein
MSVLYRAACGLCGPVFIVLLALACAPAFVAAESAGTGCSSDSDCNDGTCYLSPIQKDTCRYSSDSCLKVPGICSSCVCKLSPLKVRCLCDNP